MTEIQAYRPFSVKSGDGMTVSPFDRIKHVDPDGTEWWSAREMLPYMGYGKWEKFAKVIDRARESCRNDGHDPADHFPQVGKMVGVGSGAKRNVEDIRLSRRACYLVAINGDPRKPEVAAAQGYFIAMTRAAELTCAELGIFVMCPGNPMHEEIGKMWAESLKEIAAEKARGS